MLNNLDPDRRGLTFLLYPEVILGQDLDYYENFSSNQNLTPSQTLSDILFCSPPPTDPPGVKYAKASESKCVEDKKEAFYLSDPRAPSSRRNVKHNSGRSLMQTCRRINLSFEGFSL